MVDKRGVDGVPESSEPHGKLQVEDVNIAEPGMVRRAIGAAAPLLVLLARLLQGVSTGGEYGNAMTFIAEYAPDKRRGFLGSWLEFGTLTGYALGATIATVLTTTLSTEQLLGWGWRIPFLI